MSSVSVEATSENRARLAIKRADAHQLVLHNDHTLTHLSESGDLVEDHGTVTDANEFLDRVDGFLAYGEEYSDIEEA